MPKIFALAPGYPFDEKKLLRTREIFAQSGLEIVVPEGILQPFRFFSAPDELRFQFLWQALIDPSIEVIWAIRGGYGSQRLLPFLFEKVEFIRRHLKPKLLIGLSDVSSLHLFWNLILGWPSWHAPMLESMGREDFPSSMRKWWMEAILGKQTRLSYPVHLVNGQNSKVQQHLTRLFEHRSEDALWASGPVTGGNLSVLQGHIGPAVLPHLNGYFLFLEEVGERAYRIDRMLFHLQQAGLLEGVRGVIWGEVTGGEEQDGSRQWIEDVIADWAAHIDIPVWTGYPSGHGQAYGGLVFGSAHTQLKIFIESAEQSKDFAGSTCAVFLENHLHLLQS